LPMTGCWFFSCHESSPTNTQSGSINSRMSAPHRIASLTRAALTNRFRE
jgi:hypothetical protein